MLRCFVSSPAFPATLPRSPFRTHPAGIVEAWAGGAQWRSIMEDVDLDDGDMARLLARTVDVLRQALFVEHLLPYIVGPARDAVRGMDRQPISDLTL